VRRLVTGILTVALIAACSSNHAPTAAPSSFADATCVDLANWAAAVQPAFNDLQSFNNLDASDKAAAQARVDKLHAELTAAAAATKRLVQSIGSQPAPDIASGQQIQQTTLQTLEHLGGDAQPLIDELGTFDFATATNDQGAKLKSDVSAFTLTVATSLTSLAPLLTGNDQLREALGNSAACRQAASSLSG